MCGNQLPEGVQRGECQRYVVTKAAADLRQLEVVALKVFEKGEVIAIFGEAVTLPEKQGGSEMAALIASRKLEPGKRNISIHLRSIWMAGGSCTWYRSATLCSLFKTETAVGS